MELVRRARPILLKILGFKIETVIVARQVLGPCLGTAVNEGKGSWAWPKGRIVDNMRLFFCSAQT